MKEAKRLSAAMSELDPFLTRSYWHELKSLGKMIGKMQEM